jgi:predicted short-subunit dehydrogenase-like oxidoreductase (DUF2520 family)
VYGVSLFRQYDQRRIFSLPVFVILPRMAAKPRIAIVGAGRLSSALALSLRKAGYKIDAIIFRPAAGSQARARRLAAQVGARASSIRSPILSSGVVWLGVPDQALFRCAAMLARVADWKGKILVHSSGALTSSELDAVKKKGAAVASVHPLMTFVEKVRPPLKGVPFALEGDRAAIRVARRMVLDLGGQPFSITKENKAAYHAWGGFTSPLLVAALVIAEQVAMKAGMTRELARRRMQPIVGQTLANYFRTGPADAFSGPITRGDVATVEKHLKVLEQIPEAKQVYLALANAAVKHLPTRNKKRLRRLLRD